jgi:anti-sigma B factor antagonist
MEITEDKTAGILVLGLAGKLDATTSKLLEDKILGVIDAGETRLVVDLGQLDYVSSSGLRVFLLATKRLTGISGKIALCSLKDHIRQVFDLAGFSSILSIHNSRDEAVRSLS